MLIFLNENNYDLIKEDDTFNLLDLNEFTAGKPLTIEIVHKDETIDIIKVNHTNNKGQIEWYNEGCALNLIKKICIVDSKLLYFLWKTVSFNKFTVFFVINWKNNRRSCSIN